MLHSVKAFQSGPPQIPSLGALMTLSVIVIAVPISWVMFNISQANNAASGSRTDAWLMDFEREIVGRQLDSRALSIRQYKTAVSKMKRKQNRAGHFEASVFDDGVVQLETKPTALTVLDREVRVTVADHVFVSGIRVFFEVDEPPRPSSLDGLRFSTGSVSRLPPADVMEMLQGEHTIRVVDGTTLSVKRAKSELRSGSIPRLDRKNSMWRPAHKDQHQKWEVIGSVSTFMAPTTYMHGRPSLGDLVAITKGLEAKVRYSSFTEKDKRMLGACIDALKQFYLRFRDAVRQSPKVQERMMKVIEVAQSRNKRTYLEVLKKQVRMEEPFALYIRMAASLQRLVDEAKAVGPGLFPLTQSRTQIVAVGPGWITWSA
mmetsp:Transcript_43631/g.115205  ORF Transcript_43631/g.115205 Transcript_43631/m.115205 type:complete len:373 (-) Transcript_43631:3-1121(-)